MGRKVQPQWAAISDRAERRRLQNKFAQRRRRTQTATKASTEAEIENESDASEFVNSENHAPDDQFTLSDIQPSHAVSAPEAAAMPESRDLLSRVYSNSLLNSLPPSYQDATGDNSQRWYMSGVQDIPLNWSSGAASETPLAASKYQLGTNQLSGLHAPAVLQPIRSQHFVSDADSDRSRAFGRPVSPEQVSAVSRHGRYDSSRASSSCSFQLLPGRPSLNRSIQGPEQTRPSRCATSFETEDLTARLRHVVSAAQEAGFETFDAAYLQYLVSASLHDSTGLAEVQRRSRRRHLPTVLLRLAEEMKEWPANEAYGTKEAFSSSTEQIIRSEVKAFAAACSQANDPLSDARDGQQRIQRIRDQLPNTWSMLHDIATAFTGSEKESFDFSCQVINQLTARF